jgi:hypothetical protein
VVLGGGQDAMNVTMTDRRAGKFEAKFYHKVIFQFTEYKCLTLFVLHLANFACLQYLNHYY